MKLDKEKITVTIGLDSLAYILTSEFDRGTFLEFMEFMADVNADSNFEWELIVVLFGRLLDSDPDTAIDLLHELMPEESEEEASGGACYTYGGLGRVLVWPFGRATGRPCRTVATDVDPGIVQFIVDSLNERENDG